VNLFGCEIDRLRREARRTRYQEFGLSETVFG